MPAPSRFADPLMQEAYRHGRTQERLREAAECLLRVLKVCQLSKPAPRTRLLEIEVDVHMALARLSAATGGVIDDVEPI